MTASKQAKELGLKSLTQVSELTGQSLQTLTNWFKDKGDLRKRHIGYYPTEIEAHLAWKERKHQYACEIANSEYVTDEKVRQFLLHRYENYSIVEDHIK